jgi:hypothetical protein
MFKKRSRITFPREVLLVEIERHCADMSCNARTRIGLTKEEARLYDGFECERCERWNDDGLTERDIPDWWEELTITGLDTLRAERQQTATTTMPETNEAGDEMIARLSEAWRDRVRCEKRSAKDTPQDGGDEPV